METLSSSLLRPLFWVLFALLALLLLGLAWRLRLRWRPAWALRTALAGLVLLGLFLPRGDFTGHELPLRQVLVVDQSDSLAEVARQEIRRQAEQWRSTGENRLVVAFGAQPKAVPASGEVWPEVDGRASRVEEALQLAGVLLGSSPGRVILASDGLAADPSGVEAAIAGLRRQGHQLDTVPLAPRQEPADGFLGPLWAPANLWAGTPFETVLSAFPPTGGQVDHLQLTINGQDSGLQPEQLAGNSYRFQVPPQSQGIVTLEVSAQFSAGDGAPDPFPANNSAFATLQVFAPPNVLLVTQEPATAEAQQFVQLLAGSGLEVDILPPGSLPTDLDGLGRYRVIFLHNLLSSQFTQEQMLSLQVFVSRLAGGLVFLGGRNSYTLGGYMSTMLEPMLPVRLEPPPRSERPPITFLLVLDRSASMGMSRTPSAPQPIALAREAAMRAIEAMHAQDWLGVLTFNEDFTWEVTLRELGSGLSLREALDAVSRVGPSGSTYMYLALDEGLAGIRSLPENAPPIRHILVLSDGQSYDGSPEEFRALAEAAQAEGMTLSTIAIGEDADEQTMEALAEAGKGRYYQVEQADDLPRILVYESQAARSENVQSGQTALQPGEAGHPILSGLSASQLPALSGYNALSSKTEEGAEDVLVSASFGDPILSAWQYGLGRVVAWTGDIGEEWTGDWDPVAEGTFWSRVVRYALVNPTLGPAQVNVQVESTRMTVEAAVQNLTGEPVNLAQVTFTYAGPDGQAHSFPIPQVSAGDYRLELPRSPEGAYRAILTYPDANGQSVEVPAPFAVNPPEEWRPADPAYGAGNLAAWAEQGNGQVTLLDQAASADQPAAETRTETQPAVLCWLLLALVLLWPIEIAIRRRWLPWV